MSKARKQGAMVELWRPPQGAGDPVGCLATTYTFAPALFDEQCLGRFLDVESEPSREDLAFLLERETRLGGVYAGVMVDHTQAGVEHSLRWDVLPVRIGRAKQHAKISLLAWTRHVRIIVSSANLTVQGYRINFEVAVPIELTPESSNVALLSDTISFLRALINFVPGTSESRATQRAKAFLDQVERQTSEWSNPRKKSRIRQHLVCTLPTQAEGQRARSSLEETISACRKRGKSPTTAWIASPFFDAAHGTDRATAALCKTMARGVARKVRFCVPSICDDTPGATPRLQAPKSLIETVPRFQGTASVMMVPTRDVDKNARPWHAKMMALFADEYTALMVGSSNFTGTGLGITPYRNAEANILTIADQVAYGREGSLLMEMWPDMDRVPDPESAEWVGRPQEEELDEMSKTAPAPAGFLSATYRAGDYRAIILELEALHLPDRWQVHACGRDNSLLFSEASWEDQEKPIIVEIKWTPQMPPEKLQVRWDGKEAFLPLNVEDSHALPPPSQLEQMTADDMLAILAAADPGAAFRAWAKKREPSDLFDSDLDEAVPVDLDPLRAYDLHKTFLHRVRRRARVLAQLRSNLERPVWGQQALEWRLTGFIGIEALADRLTNEVACDGVMSGEGILILADFLIVLHEARYQPRDGSLSKKEFERRFRPFLKDLSAKITEQIAGKGTDISDDVQHFWNQVVEQCQ